MGGSDSEGGLLIRRVQQKGRGEHGSGETCWCDVCAWVRGTHCGEGYQVTEEPVTRQPQSKGAHMRVGG